MINAPPAMFIMFNVPVTQQPVPMPSRCCSRKWGVLLTGLSGVDDWFGGCGLVACFSWFWVGAGWWVGIVWVGGLLDGLLCSIVRLGGLLYGLLCSIVRLKGLLYGMLGLLCRIMMLLFYNLLFLLCRLLFLLYVLLSLLSVVVFLGQMSACLYYLRTEWVVLFLVLF